jgi:hypothetical protein
MNKSILLFLATMAFSSIALAQNKNDVIHLTNGPKEVNVIEVGFNSIRYSYPNENTVYSISKHQVSKIEFASGREEVFKSPFKTVNGLDDFQNVYISYNPEDVVGLDPRGEFFQQSDGSHRTCQYK